MTYEVHIREAGPYQDVIKIIPIEVPEEKGRDKKSWREGYARARAEDLVTNFNTGFAMRANPVLDELYQIYDNNGNLVYNKD